MAVDASPAWEVTVALAADMVAAGIDDPATVELAGVSHDARTDDCRRLFTAMLHELGLTETPPDPRVLDHFVRHDDIDSLLDLVTVADVAAAWLRDSRQTPDRYESSRDHWATTLWYSSAWQADHARPHATVMEMLQHAEPDDIARIGAGPLESLVTDDEAALTWVEEQARLSPKFRAALTHAWLWDQLSPDAFDRVERAAGAPLPHPNR
ncbi:MAG: hypothetical protein U0Q03_00350 [Acidimicrobiales bacterium]